MKELDLDDNKEHGVDFGIWELAWPAILNNLLFSIIGIVSIKVVGTLGADAVAAVATGQRVFFALFAVLMAISAGTTALVARAWGAKDYDEAARVTSVSLWISNGVAFCLMAPCLIFPYEIASIFGLPEVPTRLAADYIRYLSFFNVIFSVNLIISAAMRAIGDVKTPLWIGIITNILNVFLVNGLVHGTSFSPGFGVIGAALAGGVSFTVGTVIFLYLYYGNKVTLPIASAGAVTRNRVRQLVHIGYPAGLEQFVFQIGFVAFLWFIAFFGTAPYAAYGVGVQVLSFSFVVGFGFSVAGATLVGQNLGAGDNRGALTSGWQALWLSIISMVLFGLVIALFAEEIARYLIDDDEVVRLTVVFIYIMALVQPLMAVEFTLGGCLRGAGDTRFPLITTMIGLCGVRVGLAALFVQAQFSVEWIYAALIGDYVVKAFMLVYRFRSGKWQQVFIETESRFNQNPSEDKLKGERAQ
ncbi:MAG: hypothetical protein CMQ40_07630 [Gammaproteobacteria bacterium]|nr:hypothetical protein [Gammaproteobacteria bacterium]